MSEAPDLLATSDQATRARRFHNKSRHGCKSCKERRIKCDEVQPKCSNCVRRGADCDYPPKVGDTQSGAETSLHEGSSQSHPPKRIRKSRKRDEPPTKTEFTFVDVQTPITRKRKCRHFIYYEGDEDVAPRGSPPNSVDGEVSRQLARAPVLSEAVEQALEQGQRLADIMLVSKDEPILLGENEYIPNPTEGEAEGSNRNRSQYLSRPESDPASPTSDLSISKWQSAPSTGLAQSTSGVRISLQDFHLISTYRNFTCLTFPYVTPATNPWKNLTFDLQFKQKPYLYHTTLALTGAHLRYLQGVATPSVSEVSHYVKALSSFRDTIAKTPGITAPTLQRGKPQSEIAVEATGLFATSAMLGAYMWTTEVSEIHSWLIAKYSMSVGTREIIHNVWEGAAFDAFREAVGHSLKTVTTTLHEVIPIGQDEMRFPALEALATGKDPLQLLLMDAQDIQNDDSPIPDIYDYKYAWSDREECPYYDASNGAMVIDVGSLYRMATIITTLEKYCNSNLLSEEQMTALMRLIFMWPGLGCREILKSLKKRDKRIYLLLAYYYAAVVRVKQINTVSMEAMLDDTLGSGMLQDRGTEMLKAWWLMKSPRLLLRSIIEFLGKEWAKWLEWPLEVLKREEDSEMARLQDLWGPAMAGIAVT
ncbi:hypothetical protein TWF694_006097 [Orbilia ellipsospora]|uniref:Zn(2)-C6 fungal-type domain-containing protein n=1 Tax=Orbilia ellipsospora TaxID=2528407 RepID=A0AAV9WTI7_9PEZI